MQLMAARWRRSRVEIDCGNRPDGTLRQEPHTHAYMRTARAHMHALTLQPTRPHAHTLKNTCARARARVRSTWTRPGGASTVGWTGVQVPLPPAHCPSPDSDEAGLGCCGGGGIGAGSAPPVYCGLLRLIAAPCWAGSPSPGPPSPRSGCGLLRPCCARQPAPLFVCVPLRPVASRCGLPLFAGTGDPRPVAAVGGGDRARDRAKGGRGCKLESDGRERERGREGGRE